MPKPNLVIIADDLTGALDAAAPFCALDRKVIVATDIDYLEEAFLQNAQVIAVSTGSRDKTPEEAFELTSRAVKLAESARIFLKVDSRLKGNVAASLRALNRQSLIVAPAIPAFGRTVHNGFLSGFGIEKSIDIAEIVRLDSCNLSIPDTSNDVDLDRIVKQSDRATLVGARGLACALSRLEPHPVHKPKLLTGLSAAAIGSRDPITISQIENLDRQQVSILEAPAGQLDSYNKPTKNTLIRATGAAQSDPLKVAETLAKSFKPFADRCDNLIISGGATAEVVLRQLGVTILHLEGELLPGIPVCKAGNWRIATKSGGFGAPDVLAKLLQIPEQRVLTHG